MRPEIFLSSRAKEFLLRVSKTNQKLYNLLESHISRLPENYMRDPLLQGSAFKGLRKHRVEDHRILYRTLHGQFLVHVVQIGHRREIYDR